MYLKVETHWLHDRLNSLFSHQLQLHLSKQVSTEYSVAGYIGTNWKVSGRTGMALDPGTC